MRPLLLTSSLLIPFLSTACSQFTPLSFFVQKQPKGCQYPSLSDGAYIYFINPADSLHYSIYTPWTRFYPDALRADLAEQGFQLCAQRGTNESDLCGWETVDAVKKHWWHRGEVSFRHIPGGGVKIAKAAGAKAPNSMSVPPVPHTGRAVPVKPDPKPLASMAVHLVDHTRRAAPPPTVEIKLENRPSNATLARIHTILVSNSPDADIVFMMLEISLPIIGVIGFLTLVMLIMRHITNKRYPNTENSSEQSDIELSPMRESVSVKSDKTLVDPGKRPNITARTSPRTEGRFPDSKKGGIFAWRLAMENPAPPRQSSSPRMEDRHVPARMGGLFGLEFEKPPPPRQSSSVYSRSMDGVTLYPERNTGSWESH